jgi:adenosylcobyric acid synthase
MAAIADHTGWEALGLVPFFADAGKLPAEDALDLAERARADRARARLVVAVPVLPMIANFDDLDPLIAEPEVEVVLVRPGEALPVCDLVVLPGSKATIADLAALRAQGWDIDLAAHRRRGGRVLGICGGYQMLGARLCDPLGIEGPAADVAGLGMLAVETVLGPAKRLREVSGTGEGAPFRGYEMHMGETAGADTARAMLRFADGRADGACSADGRVRGTYVHGLYRGVWGGVFRAELRGGGGGGAGWAGGASGGACADRAVDQPCAMRVSARTRAACTKHAVR